MELKKLLEKLDYQIEQGSIEKEVTAVISDSRELKEGCIFLCIEGLNFDGHTAAAEAAEKKASAIVVSKEVKVESDVTIIRVEDTRLAMAFISAAWFSHPAEKLKVIGITGTKGKTTTTYLVKSILEHAGRKVGLIGTIETIIGDLHFPANNTTPESYLLQETFAKMVEEGCDTVVMEVSSQGLMMHRTAGFIFDFGIFTNIEPDHIGPGEHQSFEHYLSCKNLLFKQCNVGIINGDDAHSKEVTEGHTCAIETFGFNVDTDLRAEQVELTREKGNLGVEFLTSGLLSLKARVSTPGKFSVYNALTAIAICRHFDVSEKDIQEALLLAKVKGRIEMVKVSDEFTLMIDYAHNAMSLKSLLTTLKEYSPQRLVCLFGCGGNRSRQRRFEMGEVSGQLADLTVITSDNPRFEEPEEIIADIVTGIKKTKGEYVTICDRKEAIAYVIKHGQPGDIIVLAGKGHEDYQEIRGVHYPMDERVMIQEILEGK